VAAVDAQGMAGAFTMHSFNKTRPYPEPAPLSGVPFPIPLGPGDATTHADPVTVRTSCSRGYHDAGVYLLT
jgi:hypothetical protein